MNVLKILMKYQGLGNMYIHWFLECYDCFYIFLEGKSSTISVHESGYFCNILYTIQEGNLQMF